MIKYFFVLTLLVAVVAPAQAATQKLSVCASGGLSTSTRHNFQMSYVSEDFQQLNGGSLTDLAQLKELTCLQYLDATDKNLKGNIANFGKLTNLEVLSLHTNPEVTGDICVFLGATRLRSLKLAFDPKINGNISCLKNLTNLETFAMTYTQISGDLSVFANMPNLKELYVNGTKIQGDICSLKNLTNLEELGIADEAGNPKITGDLACLDNLKNLKKVSIYNTGTTNCEQFTKSHPVLQQGGKTKSGKKIGGGCSKQSQSSLENTNISSERKIGKDVQTEARGQPNYNRETRAGVIKPENGNILTKIWGTIGSFLARLPVIGGLVGGLKEDEGSFRQDGGEPVNEDGAGPPPGGAGPGGCKSREECESFCSKKENFETCSKFTPAGDRR